MSQTMTIFSHCDVKVFYDFGNDDDTEGLVDAIIGHQWSNGKIEFQVRWNLGDTTWEPYTHVKEAEALDTYLDLQGVKTWRSLPRKG
jgi:hypothetical protein